MTKDQFISHSQLLDDRPAIDRKVEHIEQIQVLWPVLSLHDRWEVIEEVRHWFNGSFAETTLALSGQRWDD